MDSSKGGEREGVTGFKGCFCEDVGIGDKGAGICSSGEVGHLSGSPGKCLKE